MYIEESNNRVLPRVLDLTSSISRYKNASTLCAFSEENPLLAASIATEWGFASFRYFDVKDYFTRLYILTNSEYTVVVFNSSTTLELLYSYLLVQTEQTTIPEVGSIHTKLYLATQMCIARSIDLIEQYKTKGTKLWLVGHGLGGAIATIYTALLACNSMWEPTDSLITLGQPKVGDQLFKKYLSDTLGNTYHRYVYKHDLITTLPELPNYGHSGNLHNVVESAVVKHSNYIKRIFERLQRYNELQTIKRLMNHSISNYFMY